MNYNKKQFLLRKYGIDALILTRTNFCAFAQQSLFARKNFYKNYA